MQVRCRQKGQALDVHLVPLFSCMAMAGGVRHCGTSGTLYPPCDISSPFQSNAERVKEAILSGKYDVIRCNFPNSDMVGHTGKLKATVISCAAADRGVKVRQGKAGLLFSF